MSLSCSSMARMTNVSIQGAASHCSPWWKWDQGWKLEQIDDGTKVVCFLALVPFWDQNSWDFLLDPPQKVVSCGFIIICSIQRAIFFGKLYGIGHLCRHPSPLGNIFLRRVMKDTFEQLRYFVDERLLFREFGTSWAPSRPMSTCNGLQMIEDSQ